MSDKFFLLKNIHISEKNPDQIIFWGENPVNGRTNMRFWINKEEVPVSLLSKENLIYKHLIETSNEKINIVGTINVPMNVMRKKKFNLVGEMNGKKTIRGHYIINRDTSGFVYNLEKVIYRDNGSVDIEGWAIDKSPVKVRFITGNGNELPVEKKYRKDLYSSWPELNEEDLNAGFKVTVPKEEANNYPWKLIFEYSHGVFERQFTKRTSVKESWKADGGVKRAIARSYEIAREQGIRALVSRLYFEIKSGRVKTLAYQKWIEKLEPDKEELKNESEQYKKIERNKLILFSIVVPVYKPAEKHLKALIDSIKNQTYENWELVLADAGGNSFAHLTSGDNRVRYIPLQKNAGISANTNEAIKNAKGDWIVFVDHDDTIAPDALFRIFNAIEKNTDVGYVYTDEDKISSDGKKRYEPVFKTDYNPDLLCSLNYISHLSAAKKDLLDKVGYLNPDYDGAQDYDLTLRCTEKLRDDQIIHIPEVLYHWRSTGKSTAADQENKLYAFEAGERAVQAHLARMGIPATVTELSRHGRYRVHYNWDEHPLVSVIIPNKDHIDDLKRCIDSIVEKTTYPNYEIIIVENNSTEQKTFDYYKKIQADQRIRIIKYEGTFNFSAINNFGVANAKGDYYLLLNNDTEVISPEWMSEMTDICMRKDVGIVGAKLYYPDGTIQHAGVIIGIGGVAGHAFKYFPHAHPGTADRLLVCQDYSAVTAACMLVKREAFEKAGGLTEDFAVAFNDVDFCMKVGKLGYRIVFTPFAELTHYESKSRGTEDTAEKQERFRGEVELFLDRWGDFVKKGDPYYNKHYSLKREDFSFNEDLVKE